MAECQTEADCRRLVALPGYTFEYLRFVPTEKPSSDSSFIPHPSSFPFAPAAGTFSGWPKTAKEIKLLDPCCGSGHFLVAGFELLVRLRMVEEGLDLAHAVEAVLRDNLHGLEIDPRCTQIAAFNLALAAWKITPSPGTPGEGRGEGSSIGYRHLPRLNIACTGDAPNMSVESWVRLVDKAPEHLHFGGRARSINGMKRVHALFADAPTLGSLVDPSTLGGTLDSAGWEELGGLTRFALSLETTDEQFHADAVRAADIASAVDLLAGPEQGYTLVITNVPYLGRGKQDAVLQAWAEEHEPDAKADLATVFISRCFSFLARQGTLAVVSPQNWLFLTTYKKLRERLLRDETWNVVARLGSGAFETIGGAVVNVALLSLSRVEAAEDHAMLGIDASPGKSADEKAALLRGELPAELRLLPQAGQRKNPDAMVSLDGHTSAFSLFGDFVQSCAGVCTGDYNRFGRAFWENLAFNQIWQPQQTTTLVQANDSGLSQALRWESNAGELRQFVAERLGEAGVGSWIRGKDAWGRNGIAVSLMTTLPAAIYRGELFDDNVAVLVPKDDEDLLAALAFCTSNEFSVAVRRMNQKLAVKTQYLVKVPFDLAHWQKVAAEKYPNGLPEPESDDPTQWLFHGRPEASENPLQVAVARLAGYRWPAEVEANEPRASATGSSAATQPLPDGRGSSEKQSMRLSDRARELVGRCHELLRFSDDDGVVPLVAINKEQPGAERVRALLEAAYGAAWTPGKLNDLLASAGSPGESLDDWVKNDFWSQHCALFHHRPFIWQIWDGKKDGFNILVQYHRLAEGGGRGKKLLEKITYTYLGDWITQQQAGAKAGVTGAEARLKAAQDLQKKLAAIITGEPPYDIFVRWKPLHEQPIGWTPDINDGVRMNIRPFVLAGVLRGKVNVKWKKDRGKEPEGARPKAQFAWFWSCPEEDPPVDFAAGEEFTGERLNDLHYSNAAKQAARENRALQGERGENL